tara:strand:+ start:850 stop:1134 length:285 start_codon:yes stop_codon:yes gene_type:complete
MNSENTKPISYLKSNTAEIIRQVTETRTPYVITQNGYAKAIVQDVKSYEETQESLALLKIIAQIKKSTTSSPPKKLKRTFKDLRQRTSQLKQEL